jgi:hypothetical protein
MPDLLEVIAENDTSVLNGWAAVFNESAPRISALPENERSRELLTLAREFTRRASWAKCLTPEQTRRAVRKSE